MLFCENCRLKNSWPRLPGYPDIGFEPNRKCEVCNKQADCHDVPASRLKKDKTTEEKLIDQMIEQGFRKKALGLMVWDLDGRLDISLTDMLKQTFVGPKDDPDWYCTYLLRSKLQRNIRLTLERNRDRRN